jgi:thyroxine 5-deiodinase
VVKLEALKRLHADFGKTTDFLLIYTTEAHPTNGWAFKKNLFYIQQHQKLSDRLEAAQTLADFCRLDFPVVVDTMCDAAASLYSTYPERLYIINESRIAYQGNRGPMGFKVTEVEQWLQSNNQHPAAPPA